MVVVEPVPGRLCAPGNRCSRFFCRKFPAGCDHLRPSRYLFRCIRAERGVSPAFSSSRVLLHLSEPQRFSRLIDSSAAETPTPWLQSIAFAGLNSGFVFEECFKSRRVAILLREHVFLPFTSATSSLFILFLVNREEQREIISLCLSSLLVFG